MCPDRQVSSSHDLNVIITLPRSTVKPPLARLRHAYREELPVRAPQRPHRQLFPVRVVQPGNSSPYAWHSLASVCETLIQLANPLTSQRLRRFAGREDGAGWSGATSGRSTPSRTIFTQTNRVVVRNQCEGFANCIKVCHFYKRGRSSPEFPVGTGHHFHTSINFSG